MITSGNRAETCSISWNLIQSAQRFLPRRNPYHTPSDQNKTKGKLWVQTLLQYCQLRTEFNPAILGTLGISHGIWKFVCVFVKISRGTVTSFLRHPVGTYYPHGCSSCMPWYCTFVGPLFAVFLKGLGGFRFNLVLRQHRKLSDECIFHFLFTGHTVWHKLCFINKTW